jgi:hypothetical protein
MLTLTKLLMFLTIFFIFFCVGACVPTGGQSQRVKHCLFCKRTVFRVVVSKLSGICLFFNRRDFMLNLVSNHLENQI